jgi:N-methylhydantoinase B/oxoprolinase/acetone carboxylase alpha subunit
VAPEVPNNSGSLAPIEVTAPEGSILNVAKPWPVSARHVIGQFLPDVVMGCLAQAVPDRVPAEGSACLWGAQLRGGPTVAGVASGGRNRNPAPFDLIFFNSGGSGARATKDGLSATAFPSGVRAMPTEIVEQGAPVVVWKKELRPDSGGAGERRGGLGQVVEVATLDGSPFVVFAMYDRINHAAQGRGGGGPGAAGHAAVGSGTPIRAMGRQTLPADERLHLELPGGGGFGDPRRRDPSRVAEDVREGLVSVASARADYGVAVDAEGNVDAAETAGLRG